MSYRSERFEAGEIAGLETAWGIIDTLEKHTLTVVAEVLGGKRHRRQLDPETIDTYGDIDYLLQAVVEPPIPTAEQGRIRPRAYLQTAVSLLAVAAQTMPGDTSVDRGGLNGYDLETTSKPFGTGDATTEVLEIYPPWMQATWEDAGRKCMFFCGIQPPSPKRLMEDWGTIWDERLMRRGLVVFQPTPADLRTW